MFVAVWFTLLLEALTKIAYQNISPYSALLKCELSNRNAGASYCLACVAVTLGKLSDAVIDKEDWLQQLTGTNIIISRESQRNYFRHLQLGGHEPYMKA